MPSLGAVKVDTFLSGFSVRHTNTNFIAERVMGPVNVNKETGKYVEYQKKHLIRTNRRGLRAPSAAYQRISWNMSSTAYVCEQYGFEHAIDDRIRANQDNPVDVNRDTTEELTDMLMLEAELRASDLLFSTTTFAGFTAALAAGDQWSDYVNSDPTGDIEAGKKSVLLNSGKFANKIVLGYDVFEQLIIHPDIIDRVKYTESRLPNAADLATVLGVEEVLVGGAGYNTANEGQSETLAFVWGKFCLIGHFPSRPSLRSVSAGYRVVNQPRRVFRYRDDDIDSDIIRASEIVAEVTPSAAAGYLYSTAVA